MAKMSVHGRVRLFARSGRTCGHIASFIGVPLALCHGQIVGFQKTAPSRSRLGKTPPSTRRDAIATVLVVIGACIVGLTAGCSAKKHAHEPARSQPPEASSPTPEAPRPPEQTRRAISTLPGITVDLDTQRVQVDGQVCITEGILEYLAVAAGGKEYESVFSLDCRPSHLQAAMLMAGYQPADLAPQLRGDFSPQVDQRETPPDGAPQPTPPPPSYWDRPVGDPAKVVVEVEVRQQDGTWRRRPVEDFLLERRTDRKPRPLTWAFTGSFFYAPSRNGEGAVNEAPGAAVEVFVADLEKSIIALWYDPTALLNLTQDVGNPYRGETIGLQVNPEALPPRGTAIRLILRPEGPD